MEIIIVFVVLFITLVSAGVTFYFYLISNQKTFDELKNEQKKKVDSLKRAAIQEAKEKAFKAKEKKRQKKAAAKEEHKSVSVSSIDSDGVDSPSVKKSNKQKSDVNAPSQSKQNSSSSPQKKTANVVEAKPVVQNISVDKKQKQENKVQNKSKEADNAKQIAKPTAVKDKKEVKTEAKKAPAEVENNQNIGNVPKNKSVEVKNVTLSDSPKEQRVKKELKTNQEQQGKKEQQQQQVPKKDAPTIVDVKQKKPAGGTSNEVKEEKVVAKEVKKQNASVSSSPVSVKGNKKKKSDLATLLAFGNDKDALDVNLLMPLVVKAELSNTEIETVIEVLLNKQTLGSHDWTEGRQDPLIKLKRQLEEKEKSLANEKEISKGIQTKLGELRTELNGEKHKVRQLEETVAARTNELQGCAIRMKQMNEEKVHQTQSLQSKLNEEHLLLCQLKEQTLREESSQAARHQDFLQQLQSRDLHIARLNDTLVSMEAQMAQMAAQLQEQEAISGSLSEELTAERENNNLARDRLAYHESQFQELVSIRTDLEHRLGQVQFEVNRLQSENKNMVDQLNSKKGDQESQGALVKSLRSEISTLKETNKCLMSQISSASEKAQQLKDENESLTAQVTANTERPAAEGRENTDEDKQETKSQPDDSKYQLIVEEKERTIESLKKELTAKEKEFSKVTTELNNKKTEVAKLSKDIAEHESVVKALRAELNSHKTNVDSLTSQIETQKKRNEELRSKNHSVMEALNATEEKLKSKMKQSQDEIESVKSEFESTTRQLLRKLFPQITPPNSKDQKVWLEKFESSLNKWIEEKSAVASVAATNGDSEPSHGVINELEKQNSELQNNVIKYKTIIAETEGMVNNLQKLVEQGEARWSVQVQSLETQLESITTERDQLQEQLKKTADNVSAPSKDHSDEVKTLSSALETERTKTSEAAKEIEKLKSQVKLGSDSLEAEQKIVEQLQAQIAQLKKSHNEDSISIDSNGMTNNNDTASAPSPGTKKNKVSGWIRKKLKGSSGKQDPSASSDDHNNSVTE